MSNRRYRPIGDHDNSNKNNNDNRHSRLLTFLARDKSF